MATHAEKAHTQQEQIKASREAAAFFQLFDKFNLYHAAALRETGWLLGEKTQESETLSPHVPIAGFSLPGVGGSGADKGDDAYAMFIPRETGAHSRPLRLQELNRVVWELVVGVYVFNQVPSVSLRPSHDRSSACVIPSAYHDTLVGTALFEVDYFIKSLLQGTSIPQKIQREDVSDKWKKIPPNSLRQSFREMGLVYMIDDPELGHELYEPKKTPFIRHPPKFVDSDLAHSELTPQLTTGEEFEQQEAHVSRDVFLRYLDNVSIGLVFTQRSVQQEGAVFVLDTAFEVTSRVSASEIDRNSDLFWHLHSYLQKQHTFVAENLLKKKEIAHYVDLLRFASFMTQFLVTLKQHKKIVSVARLHGAKMGEAQHTSRDVPPALPSETSRWSPFTARDSYSSLHGEIRFHLPEQPATQPGAEFLEAYESLVSLRSGSLAKSKDLATCQVSGRTYHVLWIPVEDFYPKSPKLPRWVHAMISELKSQCARLPSLNPRIQELLRKPYSPRQVAAMQTIPAQLLASIEKGLLPLVGLLLKRCTKTHLGKLDDRGRALIHYAASGGHTDVLSALLHAGCSVDQCCTDQEVTATQPIHLAARSGRLDAVCCLVHFGADVLAVDSSGWTPVHYAAFHNYQSIVMHLCTIEEKCIDLRTDDRRAASPLLLAARNGGYDTVQYLVKLEADVTVRDSSERGIIQLAALHHHIDLLNYLVDLARPGLRVFEELSAMLVADANSGYPESSARCLDPLTRCRSEYTTELLKHSAVPSLVELLKGKGECKIQHLAVQVLANVSCDGAIQLALVEAKTVPALVALLTSASERVQACTCIVLCDLGMTPEVQASIVKAGAVPRLVKLLASQADDVQLYSSACLGILAYDSTSNQKALAEAAAIPAMKSLLNSDFSCIQACTASAIQALVEDNRNCQLGALTHDLLSPLVLILRSKEVSVHTSAALAIEAIAENCQEAQQELLGNATCITLLKRLLRMRSSQVKVAGGCALWAIAGHLISNQRLIAAHMGLNLLVNMLTIHNEKLDYVCSEALGSLATELGDNQKKIREVGGIKPLVETLTLRTSQRVYLSVIATLAKIIMKPALTPNKLLQRDVAESRGISVLVDIVSSPQAAEIVRVSAACTLAMLILDSPENSQYLATTEFRLLSVFEFFSSSDSTVRIKAGQCLATLAFNNPAQLASLRQDHSIDVNFYTPFLESGDEHFECCAGFQLVVLSKMLTGIHDAEAAVKGIRLLVRLLASDVESTQITSAQFIACLAHTSPGIPETIVMAGALDTLISNLTSGSGPVIENCCVALGYLSFHPMAARLITGTFRDQPEKFEVFREYSSVITVSKHFMSGWRHTETAGLPVLSLESRGGPPATEGWKMIRQHSSRATTLRARPLGSPSTLTQATEQKSHSTLHRVSFADTATAGTSPTLRKASHIGFSMSSERHSKSPRASGAGLLTMRKLALDKKSEVGRGQGPAREGKAGHSPHRQARVPSLS